MVKGVTTKVENLLNNINDRDIFSLKGYKRVGLYDLLPGSATSCKRPSTLTFIMLS